MGLFAIRKVQKIGVNSDGDQTQREEEVATIIWNVELLRDTRSSWPEGVTVEAWMANFESAWHAILEEYYQTKTSSLSKKDVKSSYRETETRLSVQDLDTAAESPTVHNLPTHIQLSFALDPHGVDKPTYIQAMIRKGKLRREHRSSGPSRLGDPSTDLASIEEEGDEGEGNEGEA